MENLCRRSSRSRSGVRREDVLALEDELAGGRLDQPGQAAHQGRLAGAGQAHDDEDLAGGDVEAHVADGGRAAGAVDQLAPRQGRQLRGRAGTCCLGPEHLPQVAAPR